MQPTPYAEVPRDPYDGVPLGVEALVPFLRVVNGAGSEERNPREAVLPPGQNLILRRFGP